MLPTRPAANLAPRSSPIFEEERLGCCEDASVLQPNQMDKSPGLPGRKASLRLNAKGGWWVWVARMNDNFSAIRNPPYPDSNRVKVPQAFPFCQQTPLVETLFRSFLGRSGQLQLRSYPRRYPPSPKSIEVTAKHYVLDELEIGLTDNLY